jgi:hypothetical protein
MVSQPGTALHWVLNCTQATSQSHTHTHTHTHTLTSSPLPKSKRHSFIPDSATQVCLGHDHAPLLPPKGRSINQTRVLISLMNRAPNWFLRVLQIPLLNWDWLPDVLGEAALPIGSTGLLAPGRDGSINKPEMLSPGYKEIF